MKYNLKKIMQNAWKNYRKQDISFAEGLYRRYTKDKDINQRYTADCCHSGAYRNTAEVLGIQGYKDGSIPVLQ